MRLSRPLLAAATLFAAQPALAAVSVRIDGVDSTELQDAIKAGLPAIEETPETLFDARRRAESAAKAALGVLNARGYYAAEVRADAVDTPKLTPVIRVTPGPLFLYKPAQYEFSPNAPDAETDANVRNAARIFQGAAAEGLPVLSAEAAGLAALRKGGYAEAETLERVAIADHADNTLAVTFRYHTGPKILLGDVRVEGSHKTKTSYLQKLRSWKDGEVYSPEAIEKFTVRASDTGVFDSVTARVAPAPAGAPEDGAETQRRDIILTVSERKPRTITLGGSYSTSEGYGLEGQPVWRNRLGRGESLTATARVAQLERVLSGEIALPHWIQPDHTLKLGAGVTDTETDAYDQRQISLSAGVEVNNRVDFGFGYGAHFSASDVRDATGDKNLYVAGVFGNLRLDRSNDLLDPSKGYRAELRVEPAGVLGDETLLFTKSTFTASAYRPLDDASRNVVAARFRVGSIVGAPLTGIPADYRFYAGGGGSVRGFDHQALSPNTRDITRAAGSTKFEAFGGRSLIEGSLEYRRRIGESWGAVAFVDAGAAGEQINPDFSNVRTGAGIGLRYYTGFGPLRFDLATPLDRKSGEAAIQFYVSIGQSF